MTNRPRRARTDSVGNLHRILAGANIELAPPDHVPLGEDALPFWFSLTEEFARADMSKHTLDLMAILARTMASLEEQQRQLFAEGPVVERRNGSLGPNPRNRVVANLNAQLLALRRSLGLTARAKAGSSRDAARMREANRAVERAAPNRKDLLA